MVAKYKIAAYVEFEFFGEPIEGVIRAIQTEPSFEGEVLDEPLYEIFSPSALTTFGNIEESEIHFEYVPDL